MAKRPSTTPPPAAKPSTAAASKAAVTNRSLWQSYNALPPSARLKISLGLCLVGIAGIVASDFVEKKVPAPQQTSNA
ncbi:hypothetical protein PC9H_003291 [Pleurotus ostreatus]|uniref:Uncharacterized protein n=2 Tax=Pleurotus TaxID=5320 RepID=A0A8H6ZYS6_PLEOS|nr:uncharacterized protein PC9H_003291 [Pleurotus ostreatus]KAF7436458.1 hypothetical protein PC9H_003291 [Pleurotus ostreatus]KAG9222463.1 hypothetical protein CCMSSC00406_0002798 [Pleurotus cornucopiae]